MARRKRMDSDMARAVAFDCKTAKKDAVGTLRRLSGTGFGHLIRLEQPDGWPCWDLIDSFGSCADLMGYDAGLLTDDEVDALQTVVVYVPDEEWE